MKKLVNVVSIFVLLSLMLTLVPVTASAQGDIICESDVIVQADDWLSKIADKIYGDVLAFQLIADITNKKATVDDSYATISDVDVIEPGWKLCVIGKEEAEAVLAETRTAADAYYTPGRFDGQEINVVVNAFFYGEDRAIEQLRQEFEELTGATVNFVPLPDDEMYDKVRLEMINNSGIYDMMHTGAGGAKDYGLSGFLVSLPTPPDVDDFYAGDIAQYSIGDELFGLPMIADTNLLFWRTDLFEEAGLDPNQPPQTYDEFREYALKLTTDVNGNHPGDSGFDPNNIEVYGSAFKGFELASNWEWYNYLYAFGGDLFDEQYNPTLNSPEAVAALQWVVDNKQQYNIYPPDTGTFDYAEFHTLFAQGRIAMGINWPYMWAIVQDPEQSDVVGKVMVGRKPGQVTHGGNIGGWSWNVFKMSKNPELAIAFAKWMSSPHASLMFAQAGDGNPVRKSVSAVMAKADPTLYAAIGANLGDGRGVKWLDTGPSWMEVEQVQWEAIAEALTGVKDPQTALDEANQQIREILEDNEFYAESLPQLQGQ